MLALQIISNGGMPAEGGGHVGAVRRRQHRVGPHGTGEGGRPLCGGRVRDAPRDDLHAVPFVSGELACTRTPPATSPMASATRLLICRAYPVLLARPKLAIGPEALRLGTPSAWRWST